MGYRVVSINYRLIPKVRLWDQIDDVMTALQFIKKNAQIYHLNLEQCYLTGDSAGALLCMFALSLSNSTELQKDFKISAAKINFKAAGLISIMLDTQRHDIIGAITDVVTNDQDRNKPYEKYLLDPAKLLNVVSLPPIFQVTSADDLIQKDSLKLDYLLTKHGQNHILLVFPKIKARKLVHVFPVRYPMYPESSEVLEKMDNFFRKNG